MAAECSPGRKPGVGDYKIEQSPGGATQYPKIVPMSISVARAAGSYFYLVRDPRVTLASLAHPGLHSAAIFDGLVIGFGLGRPKSHG